MPSLGHHALVLLLHAMRRRRIYASAKSLQRGIAQVRRTGPAAPPAPGAALSVGRQELAGHPVFTLAPARPVQAPRPVLYLHGGGYARPITQQHWGFLAWLVRTTGCEVTVPLYPLAPESTCTDTLAWVHAVHAQLATQHAPEAIHLMGDSAGGGLALALAQNLRDAGQPPAAQMVLITPWVDVAVPYPAAVHTARRDPMLALAGVREAGRLYAGALPLDHPAVSPAWGDVAGLPPMTVFVATRDLLGHDALAFAERVQQAGGALELHRGEGLVHVWPLLPVPEARAARAAIARRLAQLRSGAGGEVLFNK